MKILNQREILLIKFKKKITIILKNCFYFHSKTNFLGNMLEKNSSR